MASQPAPATPTTALAALLATTVAAAQPPPITQPPRMAIAQLHPAAQLPPLATVQLPPYPPAHHLYQDYREEGPYFRPPRWQRVRRPPCCFLCDEEGHLAYHCPVRSVLQRLLRQQAREPSRGPPRGQILKLPTADSSQGSPQGHLTY